MLFSLSFFPVPIETAYRNYCICRSEPLQWIHVLCSTLVPAGQCLNSTPIMYFEGRLLHQCICKCLLWGWILAECELWSVSLKSSLNWSDHFKAKKMGVEKKIQKIVLLVSCATPVSKNEQNSWHSNSKESSAWIKWICSIIRLWTSWASRRCSREREEIQD